MFFKGTTLLLLTIPKKIYHERIHENQVGTYILTFYYFVMFFSPMSPIFLWSGLGISLLGYTIAVVPRSPNQDMIRESRWYPGEC